MPHYIEIKDVTVVISEESMREKKQRCKTGINQVVRMRLMSNEPLEKTLPEREINVPGFDKGERDRICGPFTSV